MGEGQVTTEGDTRRSPDPFFVIATQNPVEQEGTFPLPEAQVDRFNIKSSIGYPDNDGEVELLRRRNDRSAPTPTVEQVLDHDRGWRSSRYQRPSPSRRTCWSTSRLSRGRPGRTTASRLA